MFKHLSLLIAPLLFTVFTSNTYAIEWGDDSGLTSDLKDMVLRVKDKFGEINGNTNLRDTLNEAADQVVITMRDNRPSGDYVSGCGGECAAFRQEMVDFISDIESTANTLRSLGEPIQQNPVNFNRTRSAIEIAPGPVLFPLSVAFSRSGLFSGITTRMSNLPGALDRVRQELENRPSKCERINSDRDNWRKAVTTLTTTGIALKIAGKGLLAKGETNMMAKKKVAIHGYAGVIVEDNKKKKLGNILDGLATSLTTYAAKLDRTIYQCEILEALFMHDTNIKADIAQHDEDVKVLLNEIIRLQLTPQGRRESNLGSFPLKPDTTAAQDVGGTTSVVQQTNSSNGRPSRSIWRRLFGGG